MIQSERYLPCNALQAFVNSIVIIDSVSGMENKLLPDTSLVMAFRLKGKILNLTQDGNSDLPSSVITGLRKSFRIVKYEENSSVLLVIFREAAATAFFKTPAYELFGQSISLNEIISKNLVFEIEEQLSETSENKTRFKIVENFLLALLQIQSNDPLVIKAIQEIKLSNGFLSIKQLSNSLNISQDTFEKRFRKITGTSPKHFSSIIRLRNLISNYSNKFNFTEMAYNAGYFDQAHFIKDFKSFTGQTPQPFFQSGNYW